MSRKSPAFSIQWYEDCLRNSDATNKRDLESANEVVARCQKALERNVRLRAKLEALKASGATEATFNQMDWDKS